MLAIGSGSEDVFSLLRVHTRSRDQKVMRLYRQEPFKVSYHSAKFSGRRHCGSGVTVVLICHVISQDHVMKGSCDFIGRKKVTILSSLVATGNLTVEI